MSECRCKVYFEYAERRGEGGEASNGWPKAGVVEVKIQNSNKNFQFSVFNFHPLPLPFGAVAEGGGENVSFG